jgi:putative hydrolase of the HAD superfamily
MELVSATVRAIFFDAVGTLIHPEPSAAMVYVEVGRRFGSRYTVSDIAARFGAAFQNEEEADRAAGLRTSEEREVRRWQHIVGAVLDDVADPAACFQQLYRHFSLPASWRLEADAGRVLTALAERGYALGLASNYDHRLRGVVAGLPELGKLQHLVISAEVGWRKPAAEFFAAVCRSVALPPEQILYVGDDRRNDYEGASAAGLDTVLFDPREKHKTFSRRRCRRLTDLLTGVSHSDGSVP